MENRRGEPITQEWRPISDEGVGIYPAEMPGRSLAWVEVWKAVGFGAVDAWHVIPPEKIQHGDIWRLCTAQPSVELRWRAIRIAHARRES